MSWADDYPHCYAGYEYAQQVERGKIDVCELTRLACVRQLTDLDTEGWPYTWDLDRAEDICEFIETLPHVKGAQWRGQKIRLEPWQSFGLTSLFGWLYSEDVHDDDGIVIARADDRRFKTSYEEVPRKNAKTTKAAGVGLYLLSQDNEPGAEVYTAATTRKQAKICFNIARLMAMRATTLDVLAHSVIDSESASVFEALHAQGETLDGMNIHGSINDELHAWIKRGTYEVIDTATGSRTQPLVYNITTAGDNVTGICYDLRSYLIKILRGVVTDDQFFGVIYGTDPDDDWNDRAVWRKANPNWGISVWPKIIEAAYKKAREIPSERATFKKYHLNQWVGAAEDYMDMEQFMACYDPRLRLEDFHDEAAYIGIDVSSRIDLTSKATVFSREIDGKDHIFAFMRNWAPERAVREEANNVYGGWVKMGALTMTPGNVIDTDRIEADVADLSERVKIVEIAFDPGHNSTQVGVHLAQEGYTVIDLRPNVMTFSEPMKWLQAYVLDGRFHFNCPVLAWAMANVKVKPRGDLKDNLFPSKEADTRKIDPVIALLMAINRLKANETEVDVYADRELLIV